MIKHAKAPGIWSDISKSVAIWNAYLMDICFLFYFISVYQLHWCKCFCQCLRVSLIIILSEGNYYIFSQIENYVCAIFQDHVTIPWITLFLDVTLYLYIQIVYIVSIMNWEKQSGFWHVVNLPQCSLLAFWRYLVVEQLFHCILTTDAPLTVGADHVLHIST